MTDERHPVEVLAEELVARKRAGEQVSIEDYAHAHPELASEIRALFPTMLAMEGLRDEQSDTRSSGVSAPIGLKRLGDYRIVGELGRGGMGIVYEAVQESLDRRVAVKVLPRQSILDDSRRERFHREAQTAARLHHTNIVPVFGTGEHDGHQYFVMQLIHGIGVDQVFHSLRGEDVRGPSSDSSLEPAEAARLLCVPGAAKPSATELPGDYYRAIARMGREVADAVQYAHEQGTLHRDIKPGNLLLDGSGRTWVADFGLAKVLEDDGLTMSGDLVGTLRYLAPEAVGRDPDARSDVFSLGVTLWELVTLEPARSGENRAQLLDRVRTQVIPAPHRMNPGIPRDLSTILAKACALEPAHRYATAGELAEDLQRFLQDLPIRARRVSTFESAWRWCRRNRALASLAAVAFVSLLAAGVTGWISNGVTKNALSLAQEREADSIANLRLALRAFDQVFDSLCGPDLALSLTEESSTGEIDVVDLTPLRETDVQLLERLLSFYEEFATRNAGDGELLADTARAFRRVGAIQLRLGRDGDAEIALARALELYGELAAPDPLSVARVHNDLGRLHLMQGDAMAAAQSHQRALDELKDSPQQTPIQLERILSYNLAGAAYMRPRGRRGPGDFRPPSMPWSRPEGRRPVGSRPEGSRPEGSRPGRQRPDRLRPDRQRPDGLRSGRDSGPGDGRRAQRARAEASHEAALAVLAELRASGSNSPELQLIEAETWGLLAGSLERQHRDRARELREKATGTLWQLVEAHPDVDRYQATLLETALRARMGPELDIDRLFPLARDLADRHPHQPVFRLQLARLYERAFHRDLHSSSSEKALAQMLELFDLTTAPDTLGRPQSLPLLQTAAREVLGPRGPRELRSLPAETWEPIRKLLEQRSASADSAGASAERRALLLRLQSGVLVRMERSDEARALREQADALAPGFPRPSRQREGGSRRPR